MKSYLSHFLSKKAILSFYLLFIAFFPHAQAPQGIPQDNTPTDWSDWSTWVMYVVLPVIIVVVLVASRWRRKKDGTHQ